MTRLTRRKALQVLAASAAAPRLPAREVPGSPPPALAAEAVQRIAEIVGETMREHQIPGLSLALARHGQPVHRAAFGLADRDRCEPCTPDHLFRIASVSKPITSAAIHRLFEQGELAPDDRVFGPGGRLSRFPAPTPRHRAITLHHLLTHTCGGWGNKENDPMFRHGGMSHEELIGWALREVPLQHDPGESYSYSNFGYCLLGRVIEAVTGQAYDEHVRQHLLAACGVTGMTLAGNTREERQQREVVYHGQDGEDPYRPGMNVRRMDSHGGWLATATDIVRFLARVDGFPAVPDLLAPDTLRAMTTPTKAGPDYARGWSVNPAPNWWHGGSLPGTSTLAVRTASGMCWAVLANTRRRDRGQPARDTGAVIDRLLWRVARSVPEWQA